MNMKNLNEKISEARAEALTEARKDYSCVQSRGVQIFLHVNGNRQEEPVVDKAKPLNKTDVQSVITEALHEAHLGHSVEIYASGGYNGAESVRDIADGFYDPWVSEWDLKLEVNLSLKMGILVAAENQEV